MKPVLVDTGFLVALLDRREPRHAECACLFEQQTGPLVTCEPVIAEVCHLTRKIPGAAAAILQNVVNSTLEIPYRLSEMAAGVQHILSTYQDRDIDLADACLIQLADELRTGRILTLDSDFLVYRWQGNRAFELLLPMTRPPRIH